MAVTPEMIREVRAKVDASVAETTAALEESGGDIDAAIERLRAAPRSSDTGSSPPGSKPPPPPARELPKPKRKSRKWPVAVLGLVALAAGGHQIAQLLERSSLGKAQALVGQALCIPDAYQEAVDLAAAANQGTLKLQEMKDRTVRLHTTLAGFMQSQRLTAADLDRALKAESAPIIAAATAHCPSVLTDPARLEWTLRLLTAHVQASELQVQ